jgi:hypothetical protein
MRSGYVKNGDTPCFLDISLYWAVKMMIFWAVWAEITHQPKRRQITIYRVFLGTTGFYKLACPKGVKYKRLSNKLAVYNFDPCCYELQYKFWTGSG